jgi:hypothetical protein
MLRGLLCPQARADLLNSMTAVTRILLERHVASRNYWRHAKNWEFGFPGFINTVVRAREKERHRNGRGCHRHTNYYGDPLLTGACIEAVTRHAERMAEQIIGAQKKNRKFTTVQAI